jgi:LacI family transcriptional regulator
MGAFEDEDRRPVGVLRRALQGRRPLRTLAGGESDGDAAVQPAASRDDPRPLVGNRRGGVGAVPSGEVADRGRERLGGLGGSGAASPARARVLKRSMSFVPFEAIQRYHGPASRDILFCEKNYRFLTSVQDRIPGKSSHFPFFTWLPDDAPGPHVALIVESSIEYGRGVLRGIARWLRAHGPWSIFLEQRELGRRCPTGSGSGTATASSRAATIRASRRAGLPTVGLYDRSEDRLRLPMILNDNLAVGRMAARHLADRGFRHLAYYGVRGERWSELRLEGVASAASAAGRRSRSIPRAAVGGVAGADERWILGLPRPLGLVAANDITGCGARRVPPGGLRGAERSRVVGATTTRSSASFGSAALERGVQPGASWATRRGALDRLMTGAAAARGSRCSFRRWPCRRGITDILAIDDPDVARAIHYIRATRSRDHGRGRSAGGAALPAGARAPVPPAARAEPKEEIQRRRFDGGVEPAGVDRSPAGADQRPAGLSSAGVPERRLQEGNGPRSAATGTASPLAPVLRGPGVCIGGFPLLPIGIFSVDSYPW